MAREPESILEYARLVIDALEAAEINYLLGGALAAGAWGEPRSTQDVDLVIGLPPERMERLSAELASRDILLPPDLMLDQLLETRGDVALVAYHRSAGFKAELFLLRPGDELRATALQRRTWLELEPPLGGVYVHSAEDLILYKLSYYKLSAQTKHLRDIVGLLLARGALLDYGYLSHWVLRLSVQAQWRALLSEARPAGAPVPD